MRILAENSHSRGEPLRSRTDGVAEVLPTIGLPPSSRGPVLVILVNAPTDRCRFGVLLKSHEESEG